VVPDDVTNYAFYSLLVHGNNLHCTEITLKAFNRYLPCMFNTTINPLSLRSGITFIVSSLFLFTTFNIANASQSTTNPSPSMVEIMQQISALEAEIEKRSSSQKVQGLAPEHTYTATDDGKAGPS
jgi:hypothetical protein